MTETQNIYFELYKTFKRLDHITDGVTETSRIIYKELSRLKVLLTEKEHEEVLDLYKSEQIKKNDNNSRI